MNPPQNPVLSTLPRLHIIGAGKLGRTLARLLNEAGAVTIGNIYNRNSEHSHSARAFIGAGHVVAKLEQLSNGPAQLWLLATPDDAIHNCAQQLAELTGISWQKTTVFHCSGLKTSAELSSLQALGSSIASAHPAHSFASPERSLASFASTVCTLEGDRQAIIALDSLFRAIGGQTATITAEAKPLYHAATVMASNYLVALLSASETLLEKAGIDGALSSAILSPLMRQSLDNGLTEGSIDALTGPVTRGDINTLQAHLKAIEHKTPHLHNTYITLGIEALRLAQQKNHLTEKQIAAMEQCFFKNQI